MKKVIIGILLSVVFLLGFAWIYIPQKINVSSAVTYTANSQGVFNFLTDKNNWKKWWPGEIKNNGNGELLLKFSNYDFNVDQTLYHAYEIDYTKNNDSNSALLKIVSLKVDSTGLELSTEINAGTNPITRINKYFGARNIKNTFDSILHSLSQYTQTVRNVYDFNIRNELVQMQFLLSKGKTVPRYPSTEDIYSLIDEIRSYIKTTDGKEEFHPMLNIERKDSLNYLVRVGVPVDRKLPEAKDISVKQMVKNGNILVTEVTGGRESIEHALKQMERYISDYQRSIIALPFQSLETDRRQVTDSTKWVTKIFYPVV